MTRFVAAALFLGLTACVAPTLKPFTINTFQDETPVALNVREITVESHLTKYDRLPHIESKMPVTPEQALTRWAQNRFVTANSNAPTKMVVNITDAYMTQSKQESGSWYTFDNVRYRLTYQVDVQFKRADKVVYTQNVTGWETHSLPQKSSLADKEDAWQTMLNAMVAKVNNKIITDMPSVYKN